jgi:hypothetical protein
VVYRSPLWSAGTGILKFERGERAEERLGLNARCPVAEQIAEQEGLVIPHQVFLGTSDDMADIASAFVKLQHCAAELRLEALRTKARHTARRLLTKVGLPL